MRILVDNSGYELLNIGDVAMLQTGIRRLRSQLPDAEFFVLTRDANRLKRYVGGNAVDPASRHVWCHNRVLPIPIRNAWLSASGKRWLLRAEDAFRLGCPRLAAFFDKRLNSNPPNHGQLDFASLVASCDMVIATGGGFLTDHFLGHANEVLMTLNLAQRLGKPTFMLGQGIGPLSCIATRKQLSRVSQNLNLIGVREDLASLPLLAELGVSATKILCSGDDAVELAYSRRRNSVGDGIGLNLRISGYSNISDGHITMLKHALCNFLQERGITSHAIPISYYPTENDAAQTSQLLNNSPHFDATIPNDEPESIIDKIAECRLVVTASYHAGVFALSQGIPVIGLAKTKYYEHKFEGLASVFGRGCEVVSLDTPGFTEMLARLLGDFYDNASKMRDSLLESAKTQIAVGRGLYQQVASQALNH